MIKVTVTATCDEYGCEEVVELPASETQPFIALVRRGWSVRGVDIICPKCHGPTGERRQPGSEK